MLIYAKLVEPEKGGTWQEVLDADSVADARKLIGQRIDKTPKELAIRLMTKQLKPSKGFDYNTKDVTFTDVSEKEFLQRLLYRPF